MTSRWWQGAVALLALLLTTSATPAKGLSPEDTVRIKSIAVRTNGNPTHYRLSIGNTGEALALGLAVGPGATAGTLAGSEAASGRATTLDQALVTQHLLLGDEISSAAEAAMESDGYEVAKAGQTGPADATLTFEIQDVGYVRRVWGLLGPHVVVRATLADNQSGKTLFSRLYWYDMHAIGLGQKVLDPDEKYGFERESDVLMHPETVAAGIRAMIPMMINDLASEFKRPTAP